MKEWKNLIRKLYYNSVVRYIFFGGCTTMVNLIVYYCLRAVTPINMNIANIISIFCAIVFAYLTNAKYVFDSEVHGLTGKLQEFGKFFSARLITMVIEVGGVWLFACMGMDDRIGKLVIQFVVLVLNYVFSKFLVFVRKK